LVEEGKAAWIRRVAGSGEGKRKNVWGGLEVHQRRTGWEQKKYGRGGKTEGSSFNSSEREERVKGGLLEGGREE